MKTMKDSGVAWIGQCPAHWENIRGKYVLCLMQKPVSEKDDVITCFRNGEVTLRAKRREEGFTIAEKEHGYQGIDVGDLVVHGMDGFAGAIGISDSRGKASPVLNVLDTDLNKRYVMYYLRSMAYNNVFLAMATGIRVRSCDLRWNKLAELQFLVPPCSEQKTIASYLDTKCGEIEALVEDIKAEITTLEEYKKSLITEIVTKGLNPEVELKDSGVAWIGRIPAHWEIKRIKYTVRERKEKRIYKPEKDIYIGLENLVGYSNKLYKSDSQYPESEYCICKKGDVLYNKLRPNLAKTIVSPIDAFCTGELMTFSHFNGDKRYLRYWLLNKKVIDNIVQSTYGAKMPRVNPLFIMNFPIIFPPIHEQEIIANTLDVKSDEINSMIATRKEQLTTLDEYKKSLIYEYVTGKKEVPQP